jgi:hypothetical protein
MRLDALGPLAGAPIEGRCAEGVSWSSIVGLPYFFRRRLHLDLKLRICIFSFATSREGHQHDRNTKTETKTLAPPETSPVASGTISLSKVFFIAVMIRRE